MKTQTVEKIINKIPFGWLFYIAFVLFFFAAMPNPVAAQVTMQVPFTPIGTDSYIPIIPDSPSTVGPQTQVLLRGTDENGDTVYSTPWVEIDPAEFADGARAALADPGVGPSLEGLLETAGLAVDRQAVDPDERALIPATDWPDAFTGLGLCEHYFGYGVLGTNVSLGTCWGLAEDFSPTEWNNGVFYYAAGGCPGGQVSNVWGMRDITSVTRFSWTPNGGSTCVPNEGLPAKDDITDAVPADDEMFRELLMVEQPTDPVLPMPPARPINRYEFNTIINNHTNIFTTITTEATNTTNEYEATGDLADVDGTYNRPSGANGLGEGVEDLEAFCIRNPDRLMCQESLSTGGGGDGMAEFCMDNPDALSCLSDVPQSEVDELLGMLDDAENASDELLDQLGELTDAVSDYEFGDGPALGPTVTVCPIAGGIEVGDTGIVFETDYLCDIAGGPIKQMILLLSYFSAALIVFKGIQRL